MGRNTMTESKPSVPADGDAGCSVSGRREFILDALRAGALALAAAGLSPDSAFAMPRLMSALA